MQEYLCLILVFLVSVSAKWKPDPPPEDSTAQPHVEGHPVHIEATKMAKLMIHQDVVTTCRYILFKTPMKFHDAQDYCRNLEWPITHNGIDMATVQNKDENSDIVSLIRLAFGVKFDKKSPWKHGNWVLIGLSKRFNNNRKLRGSEAGRFRMNEWYYSNNEVARYGNFHNGMPDQQYRGKKRNREYQNWIQINRKGYWDDTYSTEAKPFVCQYCGKYIVLSKHVRWDEAKANCEKFGMEFATVRSQKDNDELMFAANLTLGPEVGGRRFDNSNWVWIGEHEVMHSNKTGTNTWAHYNENTPFEEWPGFRNIWYSAPKNKQPDNWIITNGGKRVEQRVVALSRENGKWDDSFVFRKRPFACQCPKRCCHM